MFADKNFAALVVWPAALTTMVITLVPIFVGLALSFTNYNVDRPNIARFVGVENYVNLPGDQTLLHVLVTTVVFTVGLVAAETLAGLALALLLVQPVKGMRVFRVLYTLPVLTAGIAVAVTWKYLLNGNFGWINYYFGLLHLPQLQWLAQASTALPSIIVADMWHGVPFMAMLILAGLLGVNQEPVEAAKIDGASPVQVFAYVVLPAIRPVLTVAVLLRTVEALKKFELLQVMTGGGPGITTTILNLYVYQNAFAFGRIGYAATLSIVLVVLMVALLFVVIRIGGVRDRGEA